ncbi:snRNA-activating protein complex subunit 1b isoform X2 [Boleophthalmus pectinirostris]|uniref:snRNA-activating protein complex subunit 1b isoform X2 n=1 Tax=Boleophthalmus pectinirostris TaxID=150288 RepID=UPI00242B7E6B|nr:snRNA-activating protein complex subunit 1b isoform X2 [Boleophthalmus pectinirostris]
MNPFRKLVRKDCDELLNRFQQTESVRFETFTEIWRDMKFEQIFYGTARHNNRLFTRLVLDTAYEFLLPPFTFQIRVGGLYLLYALFHSQTASPPEMIRLALKDWEEILKFEKDSLGAKHYDVVYILKKLLKMKAFVFTAMPRLLVFERKKTTQMSPVCENFMERPSAPQTLISNNLLEEMSNVHRLYEKLKSSVCPQSDSSLSLVHSDLTQNLQETVLDFYKWQKNKGSGSSRDEDSGEGPSTQQESSRRADLLASIKSKAYGQAAEASKSRRHRVVEVDHVTKPEPGSAPSTRYERIKRKTLKYRATKNVQVSGDVWKHAFSKTRINHLTARDNEKPPRRFKKFKWKIEDD